MFSKSEGTTFFDRLDVGKFTVKLNNRGICLGRKLGRFRKLDKVSCDRFSIRLSFFIFSFFEVPSWDKVKKEVIDGNGLGGAQR